jgi:uncharacterized protein (TIGR02246 family)
MSPDKEKDEAVVRKWVDSQFASMGAGDLDKFTSLMADDIILLPPNMKTIYGKEAMKELVQPWFETLNMTHEVSEPEIMTDHNIAYVRVEYRDSYSLKEGGETTLMDNKALWILRRESDDTWKMIRCMWNHNPISEE